MKQKHKIAILLAAMLALAGCGGGGGGTLDDPESVRQAAQMKLDDAVMKLKDAVTDGDIPTPTQALIDKIEMEIRELQTAINSAASGVDTAAATALITSSSATLDTIRDRFASRAPTETTGTTSSTGTTTGNNNNNNNEGDDGNTGTTITRDGNQWKINLAGFSEAVHNLENDLLRGKQVWNHVTNDDDTRTGGKIDEVYSIAVYGKATLDSEGNRIFDASDRMGFGAYVSDETSPDASCEDRICVDTSAYVPELDATGTNYLSRKSSTAGFAYYQGRVAAIKETDINNDANAYEAAYESLKGTVSLSAYFDTSVSIGGSARLDNQTILLENIDLNESYQTDSDSNGRAIINSGDNPGSWNAGFVHEGEWVVGDFDIEPSGTDKNNDYIRYKGAFGAVGKKDGGEDGVLSLRPSLSGDLATSFSGSIDTGSQDEYTIAITEPGTLTITGVAFQNIQVLDADGGVISGTQGSWSGRIEQAILAKGPVTIRISGTAGDYQAVATFGYQRSTPPPYTLPPTMQEGSASTVYARSEADTVRPNKTYPALLASIQRTFGDNPDVSLNTGPHVASVTPKANGGADAVFMISGQAVPLSFSKAQFQDLNWPDNVVWTRGEEVQAYDACNDDCNENHLESINLSRSRPLNKDYFDLAYWGYSPGGSSLVYDGELVYGARTSLDNPLRELTNNATATYSGYFSGRYLIDDGVRPRYATHRHHLWGELELMANFDTLKISGTVDSLQVRYPEGYDKDGNRNQLLDFVALPNSTSIRINEGDIASGRYLLNWEVVDTDPVNPLTRSARDFAGEMAGDFYGPNAEETAGVFNGSRPNGEHTDYIFGVFGAQTAPLQ